MYIVLDEFLVNIQVSRCHCRLYHPAGHTQPQDGWVTYKAAHKFWWSSHFYYRTVPSMPSLCPAFCPTQLRVNQISSVSSIILRHCPLSTNCNGCPKQMDQPGPLDVSLRHSKEFCGVLQNVDSHPPVLMWQVSRQLTSSNGLQNVGVRAAVICTEGQMSFTNRMRRVREHSSLHTSNG
jgi:hypothetical protein